jgi:hypothetical protein
VLFAAAGAITVAMTSAVIARPGSGGRRLPSAAPSVVHPAGSIDSTRTHTAVVALAAVMFFVAIWFAHPRSFSDRPAFNSPRESVGYHLTTRFIDGHGFAQPIQHYNDVPRDIALALTPRDAAAVNGDVVPKDFAGTMLLYALVMAIHPVFALFVGPAFAIVGALALRRIAIDLYGDRAGLLAFCLWLSFPPLWINSSSIFMGDPPALAFFLLSASAFVRYWQAPTLRLAILMSGLFGASILFRYPNIMIALPFVIALIAARRASLNHALAASAVAAPFAAIILIFNQVVYGAPLTTGFHLGAQLMEQTVNYSGESLFKVRPDVLLSYFFTYATVPVVALPVAAGAAALLAACLRHTGARRVFALSSAAVLILLLSYYGQQDAWGYKSAQLNASFLRYLLPAFALLTVFTSGLVASIVRSFGWGAYGLPIVLIAASAWGVYAGVGGARDTYAALEQSTELKRQILAATDPEDLVAVRIFDKALFPERQTLTLTYAIQNSEPVSKGDRETWGHVATPERFAEIAETLYFSGISLYFLPDAVTGHVAPYQEALKRRGLYLRRVTQVDAAGFYKVSRDRQLVR